MVLACSVSANLKTRSEKTSLMIKKKTSVHLRNKFHFSEVHGSMNAMGHVQSK